jgi:hypothetical protein
MGKLGLQVLPRAGTHVVWRVCAPKGYGEKGELVLVADQEEMVFGRASICRIGFHAR